MGYTVEIIADEDSCEPWKEHEGHGIVSEWTTRAKAPGERILSQHRWSYLYYNVQESIAIAKRDEWDAKPYGEGTKGQRAARAVEADFQRLREWCADLWYWVGVVVTDEDGNSTSLWGIESDSGEYLEQVAKELKDELRASN